MGDDIAYCLFGLLRVMHRDEDSDSTERCGCKCDLGSFRH